MSAISRDDRRKEILAGASQHRGRAAQHLVVASRPWGVQGREETTGFRHAERATAGNPADLSIRREFPDR